MMNTKRHTFIMNGGTTTGGRMSFDNIVCNVRNNWKNDIRNTEGIAEVKES